MPIHHVRHSAWPEPETRPAMANAEDRRPGLALTSRCLLRDGRPWIPVTGELHYSRVPRRRWREVLQLMRAGGVGIVSTYVLWIHHQEEREREPVFDGGLDLAAFVELCQELGLEVILRIGPWCHAEARNGGLPDWVVRAGHATRADDPAYLAEVRAWLGHVGGQVGRLCGPDGPVIGIQLENELYDQPGHLRTLKRIARACGLSAPLWTATAWGGADLPAGEVFPLYGGYGDGFWVDTGHGWDDTFRAHFHFSHQWDDPGIGADLTGDHGRGQDPSGGPGSAAGTGRAGFRPAAFPPATFPPATCELGGGMATAYHRRPLPSGADIAAVALAKLGSGSAWQGYYMYAGGANPRPGLQESHATGYPNDMPVLDYDFHAPIGALSQTRESFHLLRAQHAFLAAFGDRLAAMHATLPGTTGARDSARLRWSLRSDGRSGFVFVVNHQPYEPLPEHPDVRFDLQLTAPEPEDARSAGPGQTDPGPAGPDPAGPDPGEAKPADPGQTDPGPAGPGQEGRRVRFPHRPVTVPPGALLWWPVDLDVAGVTISWATLSPLTVLDVPGDSPVLVLTATGGVPAHVRVPAGHRVSGHPVREHDGGLVLEDLPPSRSFVTVEAPTGARLRLLVLDEADARRAWTPAVAGLRRLVISDAAIVADDGGLVAVTAGGRAVAEVYPPRSGSGFERYEVGDAAEPVPVDVVLTAAATAPPARPVIVPGRASAPDAETFRACSARYTVTVPATPPGERWLLRVGLVGDVALARVGGHTQDLFWNGASWDIDLTPQGDGEPVEVEIWIYPLDAGTPVWLPPAAEEIRSGLTGPAARITSAEVIRHRRVRLPG